MEAQDIELCRAKEHEQLDEILSINRQIGQEINSQHLMAKIDQAIIQSEPEQLQAQLPEPKKMHDCMELLEINAVVEDEHDYNQCLLAEVEKVSRINSVKKTAQVSPCDDSIGRKTSMKGKGASKGAESMGKTLKRGLGAPPRPTSRKTMGSTWKTIK